MYIYCDASLLCDLLNGFSYSACEAIYNYLEESGDEESLLFHIGDIQACFCEIPAEQVENEDNVISELRNGNVLIIR